MLLAVAVWGSSQGEVHVAAQAAVLGVAVVQARQEGRGEGDEEGLESRALMVCSAAEAG